MKKEEIKKSFDNIEPDEMAVQRMLNNVLNHSDDKRKEIIMKRFRYKKIIPAFAILLVVATGSVIAYNNIPRGHTNNFVEEGKNSEAVSDSSEPGDAVAVIKNQFQIDYKHYMLLSEEQKGDFKLPKEIIESDLGDMITIISTSVDEDLLGCEVYEYLPAGGEAIVAVKLNNEFKLFKFYTFDSYMNNEDEDVSTYLELYGIYNTQDIAKILFIGHNEEAKLEGKLDVINEITDSDKIAVFYNYYSVIKNSSSDYFDRLFHYQTTDNSTSNMEPNALENSDYNQEHIIEPIPPDYVETEEASETDDLLQNETNHNSTSNVSDGSGIKYDYGDQGANSGAASSAGSIGTAENALGNSVTIRIYNQNGVYLDAIYYPNISFISRHKVNDDFAAFLKEYIK